MLLPPTIARLLADPKLLDHLPDRLPLGDLRPRFMQLADLESQLLLDQPIAERVQERHQFSLTRRTTFRG
ncbi:MAG TPA: hypothetical protein VHY91_21910 [Pirellulales bacterium]|jgi:hypothetical protein|nr:hypothetical protein [Pirellulales bacterium]